MTSAWRGTFWLRAEDKSWVITGSALKLFSTGAQKVSEVRSAKMPNTFNVKTDFILARVYGDILGTG